MTTDKTVAKIIWESTDGRRIEAHRDVKWMFFRRTVNGVTVWQRQMDPLYRSMVSSLTDDEWYAAPVHGAWTETR